MTTATLLFTDGLYGVASGGSSTLTYQDIIDALTEYDAATGADVAAIDCCPSSSSPTAIEFTYTVTNSVDGTPIDGVQCWFATDMAGTNVVASCVTDTFGVARDVFGQKPRLEPGVYHIFRSLSGWDFENPDTESVGP